MKKCQQESGRFREELILENKKANPGQLTAPTGVSLSIACWVPLGDLQLMQIYY
jgi:hypothetical protein